MKLLKPPKPLKKALRQKARLEMVATDLRTRSSSPSKDRDYSMTASTPAHSTLISAEASLADLREIKVVWAALAANVGYLESCWDVVRWLGVPVFCHGHNNVQLWRSADGELAILGSENQKEFSPDEGAWRIERRMSAWLKDSVETACNQELLRRTSSPVDAVIFSSRCVVRHTWDYLDVKSPVLLALPGTLFIPGQWITKMLAVTVDAKHAMMRAVFDTGESERTALLAELLVGQSV
jgi:hypothetical protein